MKDVRAREPHNGLAAFAVAHAYAALRFLVCIKSALDEQARYLAFAHHVSLFNALVQLQKNIIVLRRQFPALQRSYLSFGQTARGD